MTSIFRIVALLSLLSAFAFATANVSGTIKDPSGAVVPNSFVRFELVNTNNNQCAVSGVSLGRRLVDFTANTATGAVTGTLYRTDTEISCGGFFTSRYNMTIYNKGVPNGPAKCVVVNGDFNIASPIYCTVQVGAPALPAPQFAQTNPVGSQTIVQPPGTSFGVNGSWLVTGGVIAGTGLQHKRIAMCTTAAIANGNCATTLTWAVPFADANYTASCTVDVPTNGAVIAWFDTKVAASIRLTIQNSGHSLATSATMDCIAMHD